jgi:AMMECR1 domain-containing protein
MSRNTTFLLNSHGVEINGKNDWGTLVPQINVENVLRGQQ